jgi:ketosteroid isomerase-like protein
MKRLFFLALVLFATLTFASAQPATNANKQDSTASTDNSKSEQEIRSILKERNDIANRMDRKGMLAWHEKYMDKDYIQTDQSNNITIGNAIIADMRKSVSEPSQLSRFNQTIEDEQIRVLGDTAIVTFKRTQSAQPKVAPSPITFNHRVTSTFAKRNGKWQQVAEHASLIMTKDFLTNVCKQMSPVTAKPQ